MISYLEWYPIKWLQASQLLILLLTGGAENDDTDISRTKLTAGCSPCQYHKWATDCSEWENTTPSASVSKL